MHTIYERKNVPDVWKLIADLLTHRDIRNLSHTSHWLRKIMADHPLGYILARISDMAPQDSAFRLEAAFEFADRENRLIDIVATPTAIEHNVELGCKLLDRMFKSSSKIVGLELTLPLSLALRLRDLVQTAPKLRALHISFQRDVHNNAPTDTPPMDMSQLFNPKPKALKHLSIISLNDPVVLPTTNLGDFSRLLYVQLCGPGADHGWPTEWKVAVSTLANYVPTINVRLGDVDAAKLDIAPLLHGLGDGPLVVAFPDTCAAQEQFFVSTENGSIVRRLGWGYLEEGLMRRLYTQLAPVANQVTIIHVESEVLWFEFPPETKPELHNLRQIIVHSSMEPTDEEAPADCADDDDLEYREQLEEFAYDFFQCGDGMEVIFWCPHCGDPVVSLARH